MAEVPRRLNAAQLAARKIRTPVVSKRRFANSNISAGADLNSVPLFANPDASSFGAVNSGGMFGGAVQAPSAFNFSAPVQGISFGSTPKFGSPDPTSASDPDSRPDTTGEEAARRNKPFRIQQAQSPAPQIFNPFAAANQSNGTNTTTDSIAAEVQRRNSPFQIAPTQSPLPSSGFSFGGQSTQEKPASSIFSFNQPQTTTPSFSFGSTSAQPANNVFSFSTPASQIQQPTSGFNFNSTPATAAPSAPTFSFGQTSSNDQPAPSGISFGVTPTAEKPAGSIFNFGNTQPATQLSTSAINFGGTSSAEQPKTSIFNFNLPPASSGIGTNSVSAPSTSVNMFQQQDARSSSPAPNLFGQSDARTSSPAPNLFGQPDARTSSPAPNLFGQPDARTSSPAPNLFGQSDARTSSPAPNLFGQSDARTSSPAPILFGQPKTQSGLTTNAFSNPSLPSASASPPFMPQSQETDTQSTTAASIFSGLKSQSTPASSLFASQSQESKPQSIPASSPFVSQPQESNLFGSTATTNSSNSKPASSFFAPKPTDSGTASSLFNQTAQPPPLQNLFAAKSSAPTPAAASTFFNSTMQQPASSQENRESEKQVSAPPLFGLKSGNSLFGFPQPDPASTIGNASSSSVPTSNIFANQFPKPAGNLFGSFNQPTPQIEEASTPKATISFGGVNTTKATEMPSTSQVTTASQSTPAVQPPVVVEHAATTESGELQPSTLNNNIFAKSSWSSLQPVSNTRNVDEPVSTEIIPNIEPPASSSNATSLTTMSPKEISKPFMNGVSGSEHNPQHPDDVETMGLVKDEVIAAKTPARFNARQRVEFARAFRVRALNVSFLKHIATFPLAQDFSVAFVQYEKRRAELQDVCDRELAGLPNGEKRKADGEIQPEGESPMKRSKLLGEMGFQTSDVMSSNLSPAKPNTIIKNSTTPKVPPPSTSTLFAQPQLSAPQTSPSNTNKKRKADVQISQLDPTGEGAEASTRKVAKLNGTSGSETSNIFKSILADSNQPAVESPSKSKTTSAKVSSVEETPRRNPFASLPVPGSSAPASNIFAPKPGSSATSLFSPQPVSTTSNLFTGKPAFTSGSSLFVPKEAASNDALSSTPGPSKQTSSTPREAPTSTFSTQLTSANPFAPKDTSSPSKETPPSSLFKPFTSASTSAPKDVTAAENMFASKPSSTTGNLFASKPASNPEMSNTAGAQTLSSGNDLFVPQSASTSTNIFAPKPVSGSLSSNPFSPKPPGPESSASSSTPIKPPNFGTGPINFLTQFGKQAEKYSEESEAEAMNKAKMEDFDSEDEDEAEWEAKYKAKRAADKKATEELAKTKRAAFVPGKGFSFGEIAKEKDKPRSPPRSVFSKPSSSTAPTPSIFASLNGSRMSSPGAASSTGSVLDNPIANKPSAFGNIFGHLSDVESGAESGKGNEADDDETDEDDEETYDENEGEEEGDDDISGDSNEELNDEKRDPTYQPNVDNSVGPGTPVENTGPGIASGKKTSNPFPFGSTSNSGTNTPTPAAGRSLFDRITRAPAPATEDKENTVPQTDGSTENPFAKYQAKSAAESLKATGDNTWKPDSPIRFGASTSTSTPTPATPAPTPVPPTVNVTAPSPTTSPSVSNLFNITSAPKPASPFAGLFGNTTSKPGTPSLFANLGGSNKQSVGFSFGALSNASSLFPSVAGSTTTSRATSPGLTTDGESTNDVGDPDGVQHEQIDLASGGAGEEDEDLVLQVRAKANKYVLSKETGIPSEWVTQGLGPLKILKHKETGAARILMRADPSGKIVLNRAILSALNYEANGKTVKVLTTDDGGKGLETWLLQVKTPASAQELASALEKNKGKA